MGRGLFSREIIEPEDPIVIGHDHYGDEIYDYESFYDIDGYLVLEDNLEDFVKWYFQDCYVSASDYLENLNRQNN